MFVNTPHECFKKCRCYLPPKQREQHRLTQHVSEFDEHPADQIDQYKDYPDA